MDFQLLVSRGRSASQALKLADGVTTVGRHDDCQIRIKSSQVSRKHCELFEKKGLLLVKDLGSANGTLVNGKKIEGQQVLQPGDELTIGQVTLVVSKVGEAPPVRAAAKPAPAAGDTAVVEAIVVEDDDAGSGGDADFDIDIDDFMSPDPAPAAAPAPAPAPAPPPAKPATKVPEPKPAAPQAAPEAELPDAAAADDAIADFLLDIKVDDD